MPCKICQVIVKPEASTLPSYSRTSRYIRTVCTPSSSVWKPEDKVRTDIGDLEVARSGQVAHEPALGVEDVPLPAAPDSRADGGGTVFTHRLPALSASRVPWTGWWLAYSVARIRSTAGPDAPEGSVRPRPGPHRSPAASRLWVPDPDARSAGRPRSGHVPPARSGRIVPPRPGSRPPRIPRGREAQGKTRSCPAGCPGTPPRVPRISPWGSTA